ncbi:hypothetical protein [Sulfidibacter corallicola]|uniref:Lipoprotein n=1 Tax=Sulfidibacter corallicola TaxID=2818388 RepID=A0A8A4TEB8_SULCO|nr:hypothetical protein [Sulfidibacter corallicola]QTD48306.1 hypothetical protein J3U87_22230 [Sulfidibacter corallicola]
MNTKRGTIFLLLPFVIFGCSSESIPENMIVISPKNSKTEIRKQALQHITLGSDVELVKDFLDNKLFRKIYHENKSRPRPQVEYKNEKRYHSFCYEKEWWPKEIQAGGYIYAELGYFGSFPAKVVGMWWYFDENDRFIELEISVSKGAP